MCSISVEPIPCHDFVDGPYGPRPREGVARWFSGGKGLTREWHTRSDKSEGPSRAAFASEPSEGPPGSGTPEKTNSGDDCVRGKAGRRWDFRRGWVPHPAKRPSAPPPTEKKR